jgi:hypothetical protein
MKILGLDEDPAGSPAEGTSCRSSLARRAMAGLAALAPVRDAHGRSPHRHWIAPAAPAGGLT